MDDKNIFAERMKEARFKSDMSQAELSRRTHISAATLSSYESTENPKNPPIDKAIAIARALDVSLDWICGIADDKREQNKKEFPFEDVMCAIILLLSVNGVKFEDNEDFEYGDMGPRSQLNITSGIIDGFLKEYLRIKDFINDSEYPEYLKEGLKKAVIEKFSKYVVRNNSIETNDGSQKDILSDELPF